MASGCATPAGPEPTPQARALASKAAIELFETTCYFSCTSYRITVKPDGGYALSNEKNTRQDGASEGSFGQDIWAKAQAAFDAARFDSLPDRIDRSTLPSTVPCINDLPDIHFTRIAADGAQKKTVWMTGCAQPELGQLRDDLRNLFQYNDLVKKPG